MYTYNHHFIIPLEAIHSFHRVLIFQYRILILSTTWTIGHQWGVNQYYRHLRFTSVRLFCPRRIFQRFFHLSITFLIGRYPPISAHHHHHHSSPLYSQSMFNSISIQFHRVHLYRQSVFNLIRTQYRRLTVCSKIKTWKSQVSNFPNVQVPFLKIPVSKVPILQKCSD